MAYPLTDLHEIGILQSSQAGGDRMPFDRLKRRTFITLALHPFAHLAACAGRTSGSRYPDPIVRTKCAHAAVDKRNCRGII